MSFKYIMEILPSLFQGAGLTLQLFFWTLIGSLPLGIIVSLGLTSKIKPLKWVLEMYVWLMRGTPLLLQLIFVFYGLPIIGIVFQRYDAALVIPQVVKIVIPSIGNEVINLIKDSSLVYVIGLGDLLRAGNVATSRDVTLVPLLLVGLIYLLMVGVCTVILRWVEKRYSYYK